MQEVRVPVQAELLLTSIAIAVTLLHIFSLTSHRYLPQSVPQKVVPPKSFPECLFLAAG